METIKTVNEIKKTLRREIKAKKEVMTLEEINQRTKTILNQLYSRSDYQKVERIYTYMNYNQEINTTLLIEQAWNDDKIVFVPKVNGEAMDFYEITTFSDLEPGAYGILEPRQSCKIDTVHQGLMIMPGLAFDKEHHRMGYGGGFYDRYLEQYPLFYKIALCYDFQIVDQVPADVHDIPVDMIISETNIY